MRVLMLALAAVLIGFSPIGLEAVHAITPEAATSGAQRPALFDADRSNLPREDARYLDQLFHLVERAATQRRQTLEWFTSGGSSGKTVSSYNAQTRQIISEFDFLVRPRELAPIRDLIVQAIEQQQAFFEQSQRRMQEGGSFAFRGRQDPLPASSSKKLKEAAARLLKRYPQETKDNRQAIRDQLDALDFL